MTLQEFLQIVGGIGVIGSLIYVAIQIRNNARAVRAATYQQVANSISSQWELLANNGELCNIVMRGGIDFSSLDRFEKGRFRFGLMAYFRKYESAWFQSKVGTLKQTDWQTIAHDLETICSLPGTREAWGHIRDRSHPDFRDFVDAVVRRHATAATQASAPPQIAVVRKPSQKSKQK